MNSDRDKRLKELDRQIVMVGILDAPGSIMVGLGLYAKFAANGDAFLPILNNGTVVDIMLAAGTAIMVWGGYRVFTLAREKGELNRGHKA